MRYCNNCNFKGDTKLKAMRVVIRCIRTDHWRKENDYCGYWQSYDPSLSNYERLKLVHEPEVKRKRREEYLRNIMNSGAITMLGAAAIFLLLVIIGTIAYYLINVLK